MESWPMKFRLHELYDGLETEEACVCRTKFHLIELYRDHCQYANTVCGHQIYERLSMDENGHIFRAFDVFGFSRSFPEFLEWYNIVKVRNRFQMRWASIAWCVKCGDNFQALTLLANLDWTFGVPIRCVRCKMSPSSSNGFWPCRVPMVLRSFNRCHSVSVGNTVAQANNGDVSRASWICFPLGGWSLDIVVAPIAERDLLWTSFSASCRRLSFLLLLVGARLCLWCVELARDDE